MSYFYHVKITHTEYPLIMKSELERLNAINKNTLMELSKQLEDSVKKTDEQQLSTL